MSTKLPGPRSSNDIVKALGAVSAVKPMEPMDIRRRSPLKDDVVIDIAYCGVCHSDIHVAKNEWKATMYPCVPGHEITGHVLSVGSEVTQFKAGDKVAVGVYVDSCRNCSKCNAQTPQYCETPGAYIKTYNTPYKKDDGEPTLGGYSKKIVVDQNFVFKLPGNLPMHAAAPLLCAGVTVYSPMKKIGVGKGCKVAVAGLGGLGHMALKLAAAMGAHCTVLSRSEKKKKMAMEMGAHDYIATNDKDKMLAADRRFDVIIDTISAEHDIDSYLNLLDSGGHLVVVGLPPNQLKISPPSLVRKGLSIMGSAVGSLEDTKEMLTFCSEKNITCEVEMITPDQINEAFERTIRGDVHFRFVIDMTNM